MNLFRTKRNFHCLAPLFTVLLLLALAQPAWAHVTISPDQAPAGSYFKTDFRVPHGCVDSPTVKLGVQIPLGVTSVAPQVVAGWDIDIITEELDEPWEDAHGDLITQRTTEVWWSGGPLAANHLQEFGLNMLLPDEPGETLYFPVVQECEDGQHHWIELPADGQSPFELDEPAPALLLLGDAASTDATPATANGKPEADSDSDAIPTATDTATAAPTESSGTPPATTRPDGWTIGALALGLIGTVLGGLGQRRRSS